MIDAINMKNNDTHPALAKLKSDVEAASFNDVPLTVMCVPRHGYATTKINIESMYANTSLKFAMIYLDINSSDSVRKYLAEQAATRPYFYHVRIDQYVSRQAARLLAMGLIPTEYTAFVDNNMLLEKDWAENLISSSKQHDACVVSPVIVILGGLVHFSGSTLKLNTEGKAVRRQSTHKAHRGHRIEDSELVRRTIDFGESHCCLVRTSAFKGRVCDFFKAESHNSHTVGLATFLLKKQTNCKMIVEPKVVTSIVPIGFGYDIPWLLGSYNNLAWLKESYSIYESNVGSGPGTTIKNLRWHRKHLLFLLLSMLKNGRLTRQDLLDPKEVPPSIEGYDKSRLPDDVQDILRAKIVPFMEDNCPEYVKHLATWMGDADLIVRDIDKHIRELSG